MTTVRQLEREIASEAGEAPAAVGAALTPTMVVGAAMVSIVGLAVAMDRTSYDIWAAFWIAPLLLIACLPIAHAVARAEGDPGLARFVMGAAVLKIVGGAVARFVTLEVAYGGGGDSARYDQAGALLAPSMRALDYQDLGKISGTRFIEVLTAHVYAVTGATELGGFLVFSFLAFLGLVGFYRAFVLAFPEGDHRRYRLLLFLFPTMWFWPSSIGKDAWMVCCLGLAAYGFAAALRSRFRGLPVAALALWGAGIVRPHLVLIFVIAAGVAVLLRFLPTRNGVATRAPLLRQVATAILLIVLIVAGSVAAAGQFEERFGLDSIDVVSAESVFDETTRRTAQGGSEFDSPNPDDPIGYAAAFVTVVFRPFPFEASSAPAAGSALEGLVLGLLLVLAWRRLARVPNLVVRRPFVAFAVVYLFTFVYAFASIENFGILARQRVQILPLLFVLLAIRPRPRRSRLQELSA